MPKFPVDAPTRKVLAALRALGFELVREREHISLLRQNADGTRTPLTMPNHLRINGATLSDHLPAIRHQPRRFPAGLREHVNGPALLVR